LTGITGGGKGCALRHLPEGKDMRMDTNPIRKAMVLAAGEGRRLHPLTQTCPKPMLPLGGRPVLQYGLEMLRSCGVQEVAINLHHLPQMITEYFSSGRWLGVNITYSYEESLLGSAGAVRKLAAFFQEPFFVLYGDVLFDIDLQQVVCFHREAGGLMTLVVHQAEDPTTCGVVEMDRTGRVLRFEEKPPVPFSPWCNSGLYIMEPEVVGHIPPNCFYDFGKDLIPHLLSLGLPVYGYPVKSLVIDIGSPEAYQRAREVFSKEEVR